MTQEQRKQLFTEFTNMVMDGKITPEQACFFIEKLRDAERLPEMFSDEILEPKTREDEIQKGFNEIAATYADWKIVKEEACELFNEWTNKWKIVAL